MQDAPEDYLVWHEIIALHLAVTVGGAEFYPNSHRPRPTIPCPFLARTMAMTHASTIRAFTYPELPTDMTVACYCIVVALLPSSTAKNSKPTSINGYDSVLMHAIRDELTPSIASGSIIVIAASIKTM